MSSESSTDREDEAVTEEENMVCPMCAADVPEDADECPNCGEPFTPEAYAGAKKSMGTRILFGGGLILALGGGGIALGSWLHDFLELDFIVEGNSGTFGWFNRLVVLIGIIILVIGIILLILSLSKMEKEGLKDLGPEEDKEEQGG